ncbi:MAG TPA: class I SAM-dependent methyltransferase [Candidatus Polarisedimenticolia bacterium]|nr:class I SAM-dependent methyltransferase [Candidatus Polarisedimenticolia bacterium]
MPAPWMQECPRSLRLEPGALHVPAGTIRALLRTRPRLSLRYAGYGFEPVVRDGDVLHAETGPAASGMLAVCDWDGCADLLRLRRAGDGWSGSIDAFPERPPVAIPGRAVVAVVRPASRTGAGPTAADRLRLAVRWPAARWIWRRVERAPVFGGDADRSVQRKYDLQAADYLRMGSSNLTDEQLAALRRHAEPPARVLVAGCGAAGEAIHLARLGYRVTGFDVLPSMVAAARRAAAGAGVELELVTASLDDFDPRGTRFAAVYFTPVLYSFLAGRERRIAVLRRLAACLEPDGAVMLSAAHAREAVRRAQIALAWARRRMRGDRAVERGDWYTMYLAADGSVGTSFLHVFRPGQVEAEIRAAGYRGVRRLGAHYLATLS